MGLLAGLRAGVLGAALGLALLLPPSEVVAAPGLPGPAGPVLPALSATAPVPDPAAVDEAVLAALAAAGGPVGGVVFDADSGALLFDQEGTTPRTPASTIKILTALAALEALGPLARIETTASWDPATATLVLVGAGDPTLASEPVASGSSLSALAEGVAAAEGGPAPGSTISLVYDTSLFEGPALGPDWPASYPALGIAAPVSALVVDGARIPGSISFDADPALAAARAFAERLRAAGLSVGEPQPGTLPTARTIASTASVPVAEIVQQMLTSSDNNVAEALAHLAGARRTGTGSFASGSAAVTETLRTLAIPAAGVVVADGSGLSTANRLPPRVLAEVLMGLDRPTAPAWAWPALTGLPVAGFTGTLADRFLAPPADVGAGLVRAKTGTLSGVTSLAGTVVDRSGRLLVFAFLAEPVPDTFAARAALDAAAAALATCGCEPPA